MVGIDFGTLSGRALVVRVADGAELGSAVCEYRHGVMDAELASTGGRCPPTGRCRTRQTTWTCCAPRCPPRSTWPASAPAR